MKSKLITTCIIACVLSNFFLYAEQPGGPKIKITFINEANQTSKIFIGVDEKATDGYDAGVVFDFSDSTGDTTLIEDFDLPPFPPTGMECRLIRDTTIPNDSYSYVDMRGIHPYYDTFRHRYVAIIRGGPTIAFPKVVVRGGKLPNGIDSATFRCYQGMDDDKIINMKTEEEVELDNQAYQTCFINIGFNKKETGNIFDDIESDNFVIPNPANNYISVANHNYSCYRIFDNSGKEIINHSVEYLTDSPVISIDVENFAIGCYIIKLEKDNGIYKTYSFIKN